MYVRSMPLAVLLPENYIRNMHLVVLRQQKWLAPVLSHFALVGFRLPVLKHAVLERFRHSVLMHFVLVGFRLSVSLGHLDIRTPGHIGT